MRIKNLGVEELHFGRRLGFSAMLDISEKAPFPGKERQACRV